MLSSCPSRPLKSSFHHPFSFAHHIQEINQVIIPAVGAPFPVEGLRFPPGKALLCSDIYDQSFVSCTSFLWRAVCLILYYDLQHLDWRTPLDLRTSFDQLVQNIRFNYLVNMRNTKRKTSKNDFFFICQLSVLTSLRLSSALFWHQRSVLLILTTPDTRISRTSLRLIGSQHAVQLSGKFEKS